MTTRAQIIEEARKWLNVPWRHQGRNEHGVDCAGLVVQVARTLDLSQRDELGYHNRPNGFQFLKVFRDELEEIRVLDAEEADLLILADGPYPCHVAFLSYKDEEPHLLHATARHRKVVEEPFTHELPGMVTHAFRFRGLED